MAGLPITTAIPENDPHLLAKRPYPQGKVITELQITNYNLGCGHREGR